MNYDFTDRVRKVLAMAREEAIRLEHDYVGTEHILLGLLREGEGVAALVLAHLSVDSKEVKAGVEGVVERGKRKRPVLALGDLPYSSGAKRVLEGAMAAARELDHAHVGTEHILLGLLWERTGIAAQVLNARGLTYEKAREETRRILGDGSGRPGESRKSGSWLRRLLGTEPEPGQPAGRPAFSIVIDDGATISIYEQIVAQVQEAVATGRLRPAERLPTVRSLADELDIAPGTVARAYGELERLGVVVTEGARGTRVADRPKRPLPAGERPETLVGLLRPVVVAAFHLGATGAELRVALEEAMQGIYPAGDDSAAA
jgi:DNA-binding transcriptional regulator YhcF (GntR family)